MTLAQVRRWLFEPVWMASPPKREEWACPACGQAVWRISPAWKGIWFAPTDLELRARCARQHGRHGRDGEPLPQEEPVAVVDLRELAGLEPGERWVPVVDLDEGSFVALVPPAGLLFVAVGDAYDVRVLDELRPSELVGPAAGHGRWVARVDASALVRSPAGVDAASLQEVLGAGGAVMPEG